VFLSNENLGVGWLHHLNIPRIISILYDPGLGMFVNILMNLPVGLVWQLHTAFLTDSGGLHIPQLSDVRNELYSENELTIDLCVTFSFMNPPPF
jgi:hypothetical protein